MKYRFNVGQVVKLKSNGHYYRIDGRFQCGDTVKDTTCEYTLHNQPAHEGGSYSQKELLPLSKKEKG